MAEQKEVGLHSNYNLIEQMELTSDGYIGYFQQYTLRSVFQPIFSFAHDTPIGYEALLRATDSNNKNISPSLLFSNTEPPDELFLLEQLSRTLHVLNFFHKNSHNALLFLNFNPRLINNSINCLNQFFELLNNYSISPTRIVIEFVEESFTELNIMTKAISFLRQNGCLIAIDDFGAGHSNFNRIWDFMPDIVKLDKTLIKRIREDGYFQRPITSLVELLHESKSLVLIEGIEDEYDADIAHELDVDFHQGYFFGYPKQLSSAHEMKNHYVKKANKTFTNNKNQYKTTILSEQLEFMFRQAVMNTHANISLEKACDELLNYPYVLICYLLDENGYQIGNSIYGKHSPSKLNYRFGKLGDNTGVNWSRRTYFQRALSEPMVIQITRPYLSLTSATPCVTLSMAINKKNKTYILCCDVKIP